jgi:hypothetical protein
VSQGASVTTSFDDGGGFCHASLMRCGVLGRVFGFNQKIMINVQESPPSIMVARKSGV